ncbi:hypothetical protein [Fischerella thermalis]|uniref:hypothetical protein n=1 Tax=Fischerella thermalis TaxID=372787 RepID=UPI0002FFFC04|nr:hypothetical protein [Fischerella thermalis]
MNLRRCRESGMILFSLLIEKLNCWRSWHLPYGKPLERVYGGSLHPAGSRYASTSPFYATPNLQFTGVTRRSK